MNAHESTREGAEPAVDSPAEAPAAKHPRTGPGAGTEADPAAGQSPGPGAEQGHAQGPGQGDARSAAPGGNGGQAEAPPGDRVEDPVAAALGRELQTLQTRIAQREDALLRLKAEMDNARKRAERDVENAHRFGLERLVGELLPVKDSMELGIAAASAEGADLASVREGVELTHRMLRTALEKFGVREVDPTGEAFDPEFHQAMSMQEMAGMDPGRVVTVVQKGYLLNERLVRPAMVIVSR